MSEIRRIPLEDHGTERQMEPLRQLVNQLNEVAIIRGRLLDSVRVTEDRRNVIQHKLGRRLVGWIVVRVDIAGTGLAFSDEQAINPRPQDTLWLTPATGNAGTGTISLWVF